MNKIREIATDKSIKISEIIKMTGLSKSFVYDVISENSCPTIKVGQKISKALNVTLDDVFPMTPNEEELKEKEGA